MDAVYIHIPFCKSICSYCDFCKLLYNEKWIEEYLDVLNIEIKEKYNDEEIRTIYIGGGTPSSLSPRFLLKLFDIIKLFHLSLQCEFTFECNLNNIDTNLLTILKDNGVNRLSIGIESFNSKKLAFMHRNHSFLEAKEKISLCRQMGFNNINIDLIYGIPKESIHVLKQDLKKIIKLSPEHVSTYSLIIEDNTMISKLNPIDEDTDYEMYKNIIRLLTKHDYLHYEISNFAKKGYESKHNSNYWLNNNYYGFGLGAHGYIGNVRYENTRNINNYLNKKIILKQNVLSKEYDLFNYIMLGFRLLKFFFFFNDTATTEIYTLSLHDALPIYLKSILILGAGPIVIGQACEFDY